MRQALLDSVSAPAMPRQSRWLPSARVALIALGGTALVSPASAQSVTNAVTNAAATSLLSSFTSLPSSTFQANLQTTIAINNAATTAQRAAAYSDAKNLRPAADGSTRGGIAQLSDGLGPMAGALLSNMVTLTASAYNATVFDVFKQDVTLAGADASYVKDFFRQPACL